MMGKARWSGSVFFFNDTATTEIYTLSLHDALPIYRENRDSRAKKLEEIAPGQFELMHGDRKSTRLNSSHSQISYAVFCLKKKMGRMVLPMSSPLMYAHVHRLVSN